MRVFACDSGAVKAQETWLDLDTPKDAKAGTRLGIAPHLSTQSSTDGEAPVVFRPPVDVLRLGPGVRLPGTPYRIAGWLGDGAMGVVYRAVHVDLEREVALKILRPDASGSRELAEMFRKEARNAGRIGSEYIVDVRDLGELADGRVWFTMPLLDGTELDAVLREGPMSPSRAIGILRQVCKGLAAAHAAGIIHRDVKPGNIMLVSHRGRADSVRMLDWGVAAMRSDAKAGVGVVAGTPYYIAPELLAKLPYDHRVDLYSLGCTAFQLLTGRPPFYYEDLDRVLLAHVDEAAPSLRAIAADIPASVERVITRCLAKDPDDRYSDATDLEAALCEAQVEAKLESTWDDLELPDVDPERRAALVSAMPSGDGVIPQRRWFVPALAGALVALTMGGVALQFGDEATADDLSTVDALTDRARAAAAKSFFLYPPPDAPKVATAYSVIIELEALTGSVSDPADARADELRGEFAATLTRLGDKYWERQGGRAFAIDYYAEALVFVPSLEQAAERASLSLGELSDLRSRAGAQDFSTRELKAVEPLAVLAEDDAQTRADKLLALSQDDEIRASTSDRLHHLLIEDPEVPAALKSNATKSRAPASTPRSAAIEKEATDDTTVGDADADANADASAAADIDENAPAVAEPPQRDTAAARAETDRANAAFTRGAMAEAAEGFERALAADDRFAAAHHGLSRVAFHRGNYAQAARHGHKATRRAPRNAKYRIDLGDAYYKAYRYADAAKQYEAAGKLNHPSAAARLAKVAEKSE